MSWIVPGYTHARELGSGASGRVFLALHEESGTPVAVKYLGEELRGDRTFLSEFRGEAQLLGDLVSPHVVRLWEYVEGPLGAAIVMELVDGITLRALLRQEGATGPEAALVVLKGSLLGLAAAHASGVVHRDYKPENVLVSADGSSKLVDFGIAVSSGRTGGIVGTPPYMAPEQWTGTPASPVADVYAATATFFECLTGSRPYPGTTTAELMVQHTTAPIPDELAPEALRPLIRRGLAKEPADRPQSAASFVAELEEVAGAAYGEDWEETGQRKLAALAALLLLLFPSAKGIPQGTTSLATTVLESGPPPGERRPGKASGRVLVGAVIGVILIVLFGGYAAGALLGWNSTRHKAAAAAPTPLASTDFGPAAGHASPSVSASTSPSASASPSPSATVSDSPDPTPTPTVTPTTSEPTTSPSPTPSATPVVHVTNLAIDVFSVDPATYTGTLYANVTTDGTGPVRVTARWFVSRDGKTDVMLGSQTLTLSGKTRYLRVAFTPYAFSEGDCGEYMGASLFSSPVAANGTQSQSSFEGCPIQ